MRAAQDTHYRIARKIAGNERLTDDDREELRRNIDAIVVEMKAIWMRERGWEMCGYLDCPYPAIAMAKEGAGVCHPHSYHPQWWLHVTKQEAPR